MSDIIAFIGVGNMGNPMAVNLHKAGYKIKVFDISTDMLIKAKENGLETVNNINELITEKVSKELILSAGSIGSPHLLQVSGIGEANKIKNVIKLRNSMDRLHI